MHIGFDIGHGETSVSRVPGYNDEKTSRIPLTRGSHVQEQKVVSAICRDKGENEWRFVLNDLDYQASEIREGFKGIVDKISPENQEALGEFVKLVFKTILANDPELSYNETTGEANFDICIASPSDWRRQDSSNPDKYLRFFRDHCGIKPIKMCINESDAAFYTKYYRDPQENNESEEAHKYYTADDTVLVIDLGSSTIDFTTFSGTKCIKELCWGANLGAHIIEDKLIEKGYEMKENILGMRTVENERTKDGQGSGEQALSLIIRKAKEDYFTVDSYKNKLPFMVEVKMRKFINGWPSFTENAFAIGLEYNDFDKVISDYKEQLKTTIALAAQKLESQGEKPTHILLSGGASRMDFVREYAQESFPKAIIDIDTTPEWVVSDGAAKYIKTWCNAQQRVDKLKQKFRQWANNKLVSLVKSKTVEVFEDVLRQELQWRFKDYYIDSPSGTSLNAFEEIAERAIENAPKTQEFKSKCDKMFVLSINEQIVNEMQLIINSEFGRYVQIDEKFVDPGNFFADWNATHDNLHYKIENIASELFDNLLERAVGGNINWSKYRKPSERERIAKKACDVLPKGYSAKFDESVIGKWIDKACESIQSILIANGLFEITM